MLVQFTVENHRSIKESAVISFAASKDKSFEENLIYLNRKKSLFPVLAIYGANAAGKTNVLHAMMTMREMVVGNTSKVPKGQNLIWEPFACTSNPTSFEMVFFYEGIRYAYGFSFDDKKIYNEYLYYWPNGREALIFSRDKDTYEFRENINEQMILSKRTANNKLYLVSSNDWNLPQTEKAYQWFAENMICLMDNESIDSETLAVIVSGNDKKAQILRELMLADLGIVDITIKNNLENVPVITTTHKITNENGTSEYFKLLMNQESAGTQRFLTRIGGWLKALENGSLLVVDEIEDSLHPLLVKRLIEMIQDKSVNKKGAQLIFTTHDSMLLDLKFFRRDQIWFTEKNNETCATEVYCLTAFSPRKGENVRKGYLRGRFGAIPFIGGDMI